MAGRKQLSDTVTWGRAVSPILEEFGSLEEAINLYQEGDTAALAAVKKAFSGKYKSGSGMGRDLTCLKAAFNLFCIQVQAKHTGVFL